MRRKLPLRLVTLPALASVGACGGGGGDAELRVFAATSLTDPFADVERAFEQTHDVDVVLNHAGSTALAAQIREGAPADVFASADLATMDALAARGAIEGEPSLLAINRAEIVVAPGNPDEIRSLADLADRDLVVVACAPEVPCGAYAAEVFAAAGLEPDFDSLEENVGGVVTKVRTGEADAGLAYATDVIAADEAVDGVEIPPEHNVVARYPIAVTSDARNRDAALEFLTFVTGPEGRRILESYGFAQP